MAAAAGGNTTVNGTEITEPEIVDSNDDAGNDDDGGKDEGGSIDEDSAATPGNEYPHKWEEKLVKDAVMNDLIPFNRCSR